MPSTCARRALSPGPLRSKRMDACKPHTTCQEGCSAATCASRGFCQRELAPSGMQFIPSASKVLNSVRFQNR
eukprot:6617306-Alexandrium_andersonii.AAC.1